MTYYIDTNTPSQDPEMEQIPTQNEKALKKVHSTIIVPQVPGNYLPCSSNRQNMDCIEKKDLHNEY